MIIEHIPLDNEQEDPGPNFQNQKASKKYIRLASILNIALTAVTVTLIVVSTHGKVIPFSTNETKDAEPTNKYCMSDECVTASGTISSYMDLTVDPCNDFYKYTCGKWSDDHPLPAGGLDGWSAFLRLAFESRKYMRQALENFKPNKTSEPKAYEKLNKFYDGCINKTERDLSGYSKLRSKLKEIGGWPLLDTEWTANDFNLEDSLIQSIKLKHFPLIIIQAIKDLKSNRETIISIGPYPNPESDLAEFSNIFEDKKQRTNFEYFEANNVDQELLQNITKELNHGLNRTTLDNQTFTQDYNNLKNFNVELQTAVSKPPSVIYYMNNYESFKIKVKDLPKNFTGINFHKIVTSLFDSVKNDTWVFIQDAKYLHKIGNLVKSTEKRTIANYIGTSFVKRFAPFTTTKMIDLLVDKLDAPEVLPNICYDLTDKYLPNLLGRLYVDKRFNEEGMKDMKEIIDLIQESFYESLKQNDWMDDKTKEEAMKKVHDITKNIAYPKWTANNSVLDSYYDSVNVDIKDFFSSVLSVVQVSQKQNFLMLKMNENLDNESGPRVMDSWPTHDATYVNAFYYFSTNGIYFPAGIAQDPFFVYKRPMAMNLGSIGMIIGHEMTHSLDTQGSLYDYRGDLRDWWHNNTRQTFLNKSQCFVDQYSSIRFPEYKMNVSGVMTLSENIADNGGLRRAYEAFELYKNKTKESFLPLPGKMREFTEEQLFFISFANMWCSNMFPESVKKTLQKSNHSPESVRVFATLANFDKFAEAFKCKPTDKMNPINKCVLW